jgi:hypothetical protein
MHLATHYCRHLQSLRRRLGKAIQAVQGQEEPRKRLVQVQGQEESRQRLVQVQEE